MTKTTQPQTRVHAVHFTGIYNSRAEVKHKIKPYESHGHRDDGSVLINKNTMKMINAVKQLNKKHTSIVDFGGGNGKMYSTLKQETEQNFDYKIVELPEVHKDLNEEVSYYSTCGEIDGEIDIFYSDATIYVTEQDVHKNIRDFCSVKANKIVLNRCILSTNSDIKSYFTFVPAFNLCFHIIDREEFKKQFESYGYKLVEMGISHDVCFRNTDHPIDSPFITYYNAIFVKNEI